jgi:hypothetical protein
MTDDNVRDLAAERAKRAAAAEASDAEELCMFVPSPDANVRDEYVLFAPEPKGSERPIQLVLPPGAQGLALTLEQAEQIGMELIACASGLRMMERG